METKDQMVECPGMIFFYKQRSGLMAITGSADGEPMKLGVAIVDIATGMNAVIGILAALNKRNLTGAGSLIDVNLYNTGIFLLANVASESSHIRKRLKALWEWSPKYCPV